MLRINRLLVSLALSALLLVACGDAAPGGGGDGGDPSSIAVSGVVVGDDGLPLSGLTVFVLGGAPMHTDAAGEFEVADVEPPYDVLIVDAEFDRATVYVGLTRPDPVIDTRWTRFGAFSTAMLEGSLAPGAGSTFTTPNPADTSTRVFVPGPFGSGSTMSEAGDPASAFSFNVGWRTTSPLSGTVYALQTTSVDGLASAFLGYGTVEFAALVDGETDMLGAITMDSVTPATLAGSVTAPSGFEVSAVQSGISVPNGLQLSTSLHETDVTEFDHIVPALPEAIGHVVIQLTALGETEGSVAVSRTGLALPTSDIEISIPAATRPLPISPIEGATGGFGTELVWSADSNAVHIVSFGASVLAPDQLEVTVVTADDRAVLPDLSVYGLSFPEALSYEWSVQSFVGFSSVDEIAEADVLASLTNASRDAHLLFGTPRTVMTP